MDHVLPIVQQNLYSVRVALLVGQTDLPRSIRGTILADENVIWMGTALAEYAVQAGPYERRVLIRGDDDRDPRVWFSDSRLHAMITEVWAAVPSEWSFHASSGRSWDADLEQFRDAIAAQSALSRASTTSC